MGVINCVSNSVKGRWLKAICLCLFLLPCAAQAADNMAESLGLPESRHLAAALADPESRMDTLLTLVAVQRLTDYGRYARPHEVAEYTDRFTRERAWLDRLSAHYGVVPVRSSLFDPAAWLLLLELDQHDLSPGPAVSPFGPGTRALMQQLFDRAGELPAATVLPEILSRMESGSTSLWNGVLQSAAANVAMARILQQLNEEWFGAWMAAEPPAPGSGEPGTSVIDNGLVLLEDIAATVQNPGPPDPLDLKRLRYSLLTAMPELGWQEALDAGYLLTLANAVDGLYRKHYLAFTESLLWVAAGLLASELPEIEAPPEEVVESPFRPLPEIVLERLPGEPEEIPPTEPYQSPIPSALVDLLPALSNAFARDFEGVDPRLNTAQASAFDVVEYIHSGQGDPDQLNSLRMGIADSVAQFVLLIPDMDYYFSQPVRRGIAEEINICISSAASRDESGRSTLRRDQFDRCLNNLAGMASTLVNSSELAGDPDGPFGMEQLRRELKLMPWQRINFVLGYLLETYPTGCEAPDEELPNPLEWSSLVTVLTWFARQSPVFFQASENEALVAGLRQQGRAMLNSLVRQVDCISGAGPGINDPVVRGLTDYQEALDSLVSGVREAELAFREERLRPGADIVLDGDARQRTAYRTEGLSIGPCDERYICEMASELEAPRELVNLFPNAYLVADQAGMGSVGICYDNVQWVERRSEPVREDDPHVANYFGRFSFDLFGTFTEGEEAEHVFGFNFVSPDEYHYLFGAAGDEVLNDRCPTEWVGTRIMTPLGGDRPIRVVPDRLTYLTAARTLPSQLMGNNWDRNQLWRDAFISGQGVKSHELEADSAIEERVSQYLQGLSRAGQNAVYSELLNPPPRTWRGESDSLYGQLRDLSTHKALVQTHINLFYPLFMIDSDGIRGSLEGSEALLDDRMIRRFRRESIAVSSINATGNARLEKMHMHWNSQPETARRTGSVATSLVHAITRLDSLYRDFFEPPPPTPPAPVREEDVLSFDELGG
jgi:hypothetical protein